MVTRTSVRIADVKTGSRRVATLVPLGARPVAGVRVGS
ncbi:MAG: hypothetical protein QOE24_2497 [Frankiales bacterium]|jgi:hypothetical protein|nr:hypothetical protein [Frankiales bacterium]MDX6210106.1 hypothetical protein [Frankiales bacterium]